MHKKSRWNKGHPWNMRANREKKIKLNRQEGIAEGLIDDTGGTPGRGISRTELGGLLGLDLTRYED